MNASDLSAQLQSLIQLGRKVGTASSQSIAELRAVVADVAGKATAMAEQRSSAGEIARLTREMLNDASLAAREAAKSFVEDFYEKKKFDAYLHFASKDDEEDYRRREADNQKAIANALTKGTPQGDLEALALIRRQTADAAAHGADKSPDFASYVNARQARYDELLAAAQQGGIDTGKAEAIASSPPDMPLPTATQSSGRSTASSEIDDVMATLQAAGIRTLKVADAAGHGLSVNAPGNSGAVLGG